MRRIIAIPNLRNILCVSVLAAIALPLIVILVINPRYKELMLLRTEQEASRFARHLAVEIGLDKSPEELSGNTQHLEFEIRDTQHHLGVDKVKIFNRSAKVIYSTDPSEIGTVNKNEYFTEIVASGSLFSKIVAKDSRTAEGRFSSIDVAEIYVPIVKNGEFRGAFEVYYDITVSMRRLEGLIRQSGWLVVVLSLGLESAVILLLSQAARMVEQKREDARRLKEEKDFSQAVLNSINEPISIVDPTNYRIVDANQAFLNEAGLSKDQVIGQTCHEITHKVHGPCSSDDHPCPMRGCLQTGLSATTRHLHHNQDKELVYVDVSIHPIKTDGGRVEKVVHVSRENREFKIAEEERKRLEEMLARSQKMEALGLLAGGVAHDLNNVLSGIVSYPDLLLLDLPPSSPLREPIETIRQSGKKAAAIVQDLLTLARRGVITMEVVNLNDIVKDYLKSPEFSKVRQFHSHLEVRTQLDPNLFNLKGSDVHLKKTLMNLVSNAAEAMPPHGGRITITTANQYIDGPLEGYEQVNEGDYVKLTVADNGIGMADEDLVRIFEPFFTKKEMGRSGTGLGMSVVWGAVKDHHGYIQSSSQLGRGSAFSLFFPATRDQITGEKMVVDIDAYVGRGESVLVVDDLTDQRKIASSIFQRLGYEVATAASGQAAVEYIRGRHVDLVVLDMIMEPGMDGLDTYRQLLRINPRQKAIIASGYTQTHRVRQAAALGAGGYLKKPYTLENLGLAARRALDA